MIREGDFVAQRSPDWARLVQLTDAVRAARHMPAEEFREFVETYRRVCRDLVTIRTESTNFELATYLNDIVGRAYCYLYEAPRSSLSEGVRNFLGDAARSVRRNWPFFAASLTIFFAALGFGWYIMAMRRDLSPAVIPPGMQDVVEIWKSGVHPQASAAQSLTMWTFYSVNNPMVALLTAAASLASFGLITVKLIWTNGVLLGALMHETATTGKLGFLLSSIAPHGASELTGAIVAGGAGLMMGWAVISPGRLTRVESIRLKGLEVLPVILLSVLMMFIAAPIEAYFSFNPGVPTWLKILFALCAATAWTIFFLGYGRTTAAQRKRRIKLRPDAEPAQDDGLRLEPSQAGSEEVRQELHLK